MSCQRFLPRRHQLWLIALSWLLWPVLPAPASAPMNGLTITPAVKQIQVAAGQQRAAFICTVTNDTAASIALAIATRDFTSLGNNAGGLNFLSGQSPDRSHGLAAWMDISPTRLTLAPGSSQTIPVVINHTDRLAPGGHYAALMFKVVVAPGNAPGNRITTNEVVTSLVFLTAYGRAVQTVSLKPPRQAAVTFHLPGSSDLVFDNTGNTQIAPHGLVTLLSPTHHEIARGLINVDSGLVLPSTSRLYTVPLRPNHGLLYPGLYRLRVSYRADNGSPSTYIKTFLFINEPLLIGFGFVLVGLAVWLIRRTAPVQKYLLRRKA